MLCCLKLGIKDLISASISSFHSEGNVGRLCHGLTSRICLTCELPKSQMFICATSWIVQSTFERYPIGSYNY